MFLSSSCEVCGLFRLSMTVWFSSSYCGAFWCVGDLNSKTDSIKTSSKIMIFSILLNWIHMYFSHYRIIKYVGFKLIYCAIDLDVVSSFRVFSELDYLFILNVLLV